MQHNHMARSVADGVPLVDIKECSSFLKNNTFDNNTAAGYEGGLVRFEKPPDLQLSSCYFHNNSVMTSGGGAVYVK